MHILHAAVKAILSVSYLTQKELTQKKKKNFVNFPEDQDDKKSEASFLLEERAKIVCSSLNSSWSRTSTLRQLVSSIGWRGDQRSLAILGIITVIMKATNESKKESNLKILV